MPKERKASGDQPILKKPGESTVATSLLKFTADCEISRGL
jgi:hypothetical protein